MSLQDIVRERTYVIRDAIQQLDARILTLQQEMSALDMSAGKYEDEAKNLNVSKKEMEHTRDDIYSRYNELKRQKKNLETRLDQNKAELERIEEDITKISGEQKKYKTEAATANEKAYKVKDDIEKKLVHKVQQGRELVNQRAKAFNEYNQLLWENLLQSKQSQDEIAKKSSARDRLKEAERSDPQVAQLLEAKNDWARIIKVSVTQSVKETAKRELVQIDDEIEKRFPGAIDALDGRTGIEEIHEIYFAPNQNAKGVDLYLPITNEVWRQIEGGVREIQTDFAMHLFWSFIKELDLSSNNDGFLHIGGRCVLRCSLDEKKLEDKTSVSLRLSAESKIDFILIRLDGEMQEAIHENLNL